MKTKLLVIGSCAAIVVIIAICFGTICGFRGFGLSRDRLAVITFYSSASVNSTRVERTNNGVVNKVQKWLDNVTVGQPSLAKIGPVKPWCYVEIYEFEGEAKRVVSQTEVFLVDGSGNSPRLLSQVDQKALLDILGLSGIPLQ